MGLNKYLKIILTVSVFFFNFQVDGIPEAIPNDPDYFRGGYREFDTGISFTFMKPKDGTVVWQRAAFSRWMERIKYEILRNMELNHKCDVDINLIFWG